MPRTGVYTSPQERQNLRQSYYATSGKEAGVAHLWHMQQLADIRFSPNHTIQDVPEVDFRSSGSPADEYRALFAKRYAQQLQHDEARLYAENQAIYRSIVLASDDAARSARNMNLVPTESQVRRFDNIQQQTLHRTQDRERRQRGIAEENKKLLDHLVSVPPHVRPARELDAWYHDVHKRRVAQLSRFKPAEPYAGAHLLEGSRHTGAEKGRAADRTVAAAIPLVRGQPYPAGGSTMADSTAPVSGRHVRRPEWQALAATDILLLHRGADQQLRAGQPLPSSNSGRQQRESSPSARAPTPAHRELFPAPSGASPGAAAAHTSGSAANTIGSNSARMGRRVTAQEEGGVTQLWRRAVEERHGSAASPPPPQQQPGPCAASARVSHGEMRGGCVSSVPPTRAPYSSSPSSSRPVQHQPQQSQQPARPLSALSSGNSSSAEGQVRLSASVPLLASTRVPVAPVQAAAPQTSTPGRSSPARRQEEDDDDADSAAAAALRELMAGWSRRSEASGAAYVPM